MNLLAMMDYSENFMHPNIDLSNSLCERVLYKITTNGGRKINYDLFI